MDFLLRIILATALLALTACNGGGSQSISGKNNNGGGNSFANEPAFETEQSELDAGLVCTDFTHPDKPPVLLVHGTFTYGWEQYEWSYGPILEEMGFDVCTVTYPDRGFGDQQISAEYVVNALRRIHAESGRKVAMIGHSQGASMPRWALKFWPSARNAVEDFVLHAAPAHGLDLYSSPLANILPGITGMPAAFYQFNGESNFVRIVNSGDETPGDIDYTSIYTQFDELVQPVEPVPTAALDWGIFPSTFGMPAGFYQFDDKSNFTRIVNEGDETPGDIDYTSIYTQFDELVQPVEPVPTAALDWGMENPKVSNILLQDICPGLLAEHASIGLTDMATFLLTLDAILNPGPADIERAGDASTLCSPASPLPGVSLPPDFLLKMIEQIPASMEQGMHEFHNTSEEPPTKPYAQGEE